MVAVFINLSPGLIRSQKFLPQKSMGIFLFFHFFTGLESNASEKKELLDAMKN